MMATYNGVTVYGTPQEIAEFAKEVERQHKPDATWSKVGAGTFRINPTPTNIALLNSKETVLSKEQADEMFRKLSQELAKQVIK